MKMEKEYTGQFPSKNCECHIQESYGFVPEADCKEHDTQQFSDFLKAMRQAITTELIKKLEEVEEKKTWILEKEEYHIASDADRAALIWNAARQAILNNAREVTKEI